jgi:hypothetical protein
MALLDGSYRFSYLRHCRVEPGVMAAWLGVLMRVSGLTLAVGLAMALLVVNLANLGAMPSAAGLLTIAGAAMFVGALSLFLLYASRSSERE